MTTVKSRRWWKNEINMANNSSYIKTTGKKPNTGSVHVFEATPFSAQGILNSVNKEFPYNEVVMDIIERKLYGNVYEIYVVMG
tara:strand:- start:2703 stop:2951 length:249 start_codon:yes stop_codon:yes gene_type:complete